MAIHRPRKRGIRTCDLAGTKFSTESTYCPNLEEPSSILKAPDPTPVSKKTPKGGKNIHVSTRVVDERSRAGLILASTSSDKGSSLDFRRK